MKEEKIQKKESKKWLKSVIINLIIAVVAILYLVALMFLANAYMFDTLIKIPTVILLIIGIILLERYYRKENKMIALASVEVLCIAAHTVSINHVLKLFNFEFQNYIIASIVTVLIYYILKCIIIFTHEKRKSLKDLSDISKIVKEDKPVKKEATKKKEENEEEVVIKEPEKTVKKEITKKEPAKTTEKKETTKKEPAKTTAKKETTKKEPAKTTVKKETTKKEPAKTTVKTETIKKDVTEKEKIEEKPKRRGRPKKEVAEND